MRISPAISKSQRIKGEKVVDNKKSGKISTRTIVLNMRKPKFGTAEDGLGIQKEKNKCYKWATQLLLEKYRELGSRVLPYMVVKPTYIFRHWRVFIGRQGSVLSHMSDMSQILQEMGEFETLSKRASEPCSVHEALLPLLQSV